MNEGGPRLVELPKRIPLTDAAAHLRLLADDIEHGAYGATVEVGLVLRPANSEPLLVCGYGNTDPERVAVLLMMGQHRIAQLLVQHGSLSRGGS